MTGNAPLQDLAPMLKALLIDRFKMKAHFEDRPVNAYTLVAAKPKLKKADPSERAGCKQDPGAVPATITTPMNAFTCTNTTMAELVKNMPIWANAYVDHPVIDTSGLQGGWDFTLMWTPRGALPQAQPGQAVPIDPGGLTFFEGGEKLGLKLEKGSHPMPVLVIDHAEEKPID